MKATLKKLSALILMLGTVFVLSFSSMRTLQIREVQIILN
ncbi:hypothetical protein FACS1894192_12600 [Bacilli bacterium]|nr:hypothetical protein FACS1894192_12600 [Bacilli bacterium]